MNLGVLGLFKYFDFGVAEMSALLQKLGYDTTEVGRVVPPAGRKAVFLGDLVDRGPRIVPVLRTVMAMVRAVMVMRRGPPASSRAAASGRRGRRAMRGSP